MRRFNLPAQHAGNPSKIMVDLLRLTLKCVNYINSFYSCVTISHIERLTFTV